MLEEFRNSLLHDFPTLSGKKLLLAVSGGIDSMVMTDIFMNSGFAITLAHCNFMLRGEESDADETFVREFGLKNNIRVFTTQFDTASFASDYKLSIQQAARQLRYAWFYELLSGNKLDFVATAHHADDNLETFIINLSRGTGIDGLTGILKQNESIIRPMLAFTKNQISVYAKAHDIEWREDSSNASDDYLRNTIRHNIVPALKEINPDFAGTLHKTQCYLQQTKSLAEDASILIYRQLVIEKENRYLIKIAELLQLTNYEAYLYHWLNKFGFEAWSDIYRLPKGLSGKQVLSKRFRIFKDREILILEQIPEMAPADFYSIESIDSEIEFPVHLKLCRAEGISGASVSTIFVDADKLTFPLTLRKWNEGDSFQPLGMNGQSKNVSKLFKDAKLSLSDKNNIWLLCSEGEIVWVGGMRQDERFKIDDTTKHILKIELIP